MKHAKRLDGTTVKPEVTYTRQQKGHSTTLHVVGCLLTGGLMLPVTLYFVFSPNHFFHA